MTTALHELIAGFSPVDRDAIMKTLISDDFSRRFEILLRQEDDGPVILDDLYGSELLRLPGGDRMHDAIDTLLLGFLPDEQLTGRRGTLLTTRELVVINVVFMRALVAEKSLVMAEDAITALRGISSFAEKSPARER